MNHHHHHIDRMRSRPDSLAAVRPRRTTTEELERVKGQQQQQRQKQKQKQQQQQQQTHPTPPQHQHEQPAAKQKLSKEFLERISNHVLEHTKQLGLFDELRMRLLSQIEARREFADVERDFSDEVKQFCRRKLNLDHPRTKLRQQLSEFAQDEERSKLTRNLNRNIQHVIQRHKHDLLADYSERASPFLAKFVARPAPAPAPAPAPVAAAAETPALLDSAMITPPELDEIPLPPGDEPPEPDEQCPQLLLADMAAETATKTTATDGGPHSQQPTAELCLDCSSSSSPPNSAASAKSIDSGFSSSYTVNSTPSTMQTPSPLVVAGKTPALVPSDPSTPSQTTTTTAITVDNNNTHTDSEHVDGQPADRSRPARSVVIRPTGFGCVLERNKKRAAKKKKKKNKKNKNRKQNQRARNAQPDRQCQQADPGGGSGGTCSSRTGPSDECAASQRVPRPLRRESPVRPASRPSSGTKPLPLARRASPQERRRRRSTDRSPERGSRRREQARRWASSSRSPERTLPRGASRAERRGRSRSRSRSPRRSRRAAVRSAPRSPPRGPRTPPDSRRSSPKRYADEREPTKRRRRDDERWRGSRARSASRH
jgi:hypothetical protein